MKSIRQIEAGAVMGHGQGWYSEFERGQRGATAEELQNLAKLFKSNLRSWELENKEPADA